MARGVACWLSARRAARSSASACANSICAREVFSVSGMHSSAARRAARAEAKKGGSAPSSGRKM